MTRFSERNAFVYLLIEEVLHQTLVTLFIIVDLLARTTTRKRRRSETVERYSMITRIPDQVKHLNRLVGFNDTNCIKNLRMDRNTFGRLCLLLRQLGGLSDGKYVSVEEQVAVFLAIISHHKKNCIVGFDFWRSGQTISHYIHVVLKAILKLHGILLVKPTPVADDSTDPRWKWFKGCLGALDGTYIPAMVHTVDKPRYRTRKGQISTNVLAVCDQHLKFVYVLPGWEGSAADARVLRDAVNRVHGLKVPKGTYYLCDNGYANSEGFLSPYKGVRYHLDDWGPASQRPQNAQENFNMRHTRARNVIERAFGIMKMRWGIFRSSTYYPVKIQNRLIMASFILHNFIRSEMAVDPIEQLLDSLPIQHEPHEEEDEIIDAVESSPEWNNMRDQIAQDMWSSL